MITTNLCKKLGVLSLEKIAGEIDADEFISQVDTLVKQAGIDITPVAKFGKSLLDTLTLKDAVKAMNPSRMRRIAHGGKYNYGDLIHGAAKAALLGVPVAYTVSALNDAEKDERRNDLRIKYYNETKKNKGTQGVSYDN